MGRNYKYHCTNCEYSVTTSGKRDVGMIAVVKTMICEDCKEAVDVRIGSYGKNGRTGDPELDKRLNICPLCDRSNLKSWPRQHPCPKCQSKMVRDKNDPFVLWD